VTVRSVQPKTEVEIDLADLLERLLDEHGYVLDIEHSPDGETPLPFGVWCRGGAQGDDLIGTGETMTEALAEAVNAARAWEAAP
jgi:hypothetical protein